MRIFPAEEESKLYELELARGWARSGLISQDQLSAMETGLGPTLAQAGWVIRLLFFAFCACAQLALCDYLTAGIRIQSLEGRYLLGTAVLCYALGEFLIRWFRLHRFGVEEALLAGAAVQFSIGLYLVMPEKFGFFTHDRAFAACCAAAALCAWLYKRCGYLYATFAAIVALSVAVGCLALPEQPTRIWLACLYCLLLAVTLLRDEPEHEKDDRMFVRAALFMWTYLVLNLRLNEIANVPGLPGRPSLYNGEAIATGFFYWTTFALIWALPAAGMFWGVKRRQRPILAASAVMALITVMTYKPYLNWQRHSWDAALLGAAMMALAAWLTLWLDSGPESRRAGFTARPAIMARDEGLGAAALLAAAAAGTAAQAPATEKPGFEGGGGSSGGGGASGDY